MPGCVPVRYLMVLLAAGGTLVQMLIKLSLSVTIVAMVKSTPSNNHSSSYTASNNHSSSHTTSNSTVQGDGEFAWNSTMQGFMLSAFFYGYITTQVLSGWLAEKVGAKLVMGCGIVCAGVFTLLGPLATNYGAYVFAASRILVGACMGMFYAPQMLFISKWIPPEEYQVMAGLLNACSIFSTMASLSCAGVLCNYSWRLVFYVYGSCAVLWFVLWMCLACETPAQHPSISHKEFVYITKRTEDDDGNNTKKLNPVPWLSIMTCVPVWAQTFMQMSGAYLSYTLASEMPTYMKNILHYDIQSSGIISSLPYVFGGIGCACFGIASQWLQTKGILSHMAAYRIFNGIYALGTTICLIVVPMAGNDKTTAVLLLITTMVFYNAYYGGSAVNMMDLAINYVGILTGIMQTFANAMGIVAPQVAGILTNEQQTAGQWAKVFYIAGGVSVPAFIFYLFFGSVKEQEWNKQGDEEMSDPATEKTQPAKKLSIDQFPII